jgi:hypothetical protein
MRCLVNGAPVKRTLFIQGELGSRQVPEASLGELVLAFDRDEFVHMLADEYRLLVQELADDVAKVGGADEDERACLQETELSGLMDRAPGALPSLLRDYLWGDLCRVCFGENREDQCEYVVSKFRDLSLSDSEVIIRGSVYSMPRAARA